MSDRMLKILLTAFTIVTVLAVLLLLGLTLFGGSSIKDPTASPSSGLGSPEPFRADLLKRN
jgi:hypothetical protein